MYKKNWSTYTGTHCTLMPKKKHVTKYRFLWVQELNEYIILTIKYREIKF